MAGKQSGLGWTTLEIDDVGGTARDLRNDFHALQFATPLAIQDVTGLDNYAFERLALLSDFSITLTGAALNPDVNKSHDVLASVTDRRTPRTTTLVIGGQTLTSTVLYTDYALARGAEGSLIPTVPGVMSDGVEPAWT
jgi:hypothetical protein